MHGNGMSDPQEYSSLKAMKAAKVGKLGGTERKQTVHQLGPFSQEGIVSLPHFICHTPGFLQFGSAALTQCPTFK